MKAVCLAKITAKPFPKKSERETSQPLELVHSDICGPMQVESVGGSKYFVTFIDDYSKYTTVYMISHRSEALEKFMEFVQMAENFTGLRVKELRSDNAKEYISEDFKKYCKRRGIIRQETIPYSPQQNGKAERMNRTIMETVRWMIHKAGLPLNFWAEAVATAVYLRNRSPTACIKEATPYECWHKEKPDISHLRVFGCNAFVHIPDQKRRKLDQKSIRCIFVGYPSNCKGYKLYNPETKKFLRSRDVVFMESSFGHSSFEGQEQNVDQLIDKEYFYPDFKYEDHDRKPENQQNVPEAPPARPQRNRDPLNRYGAVIGEWWNYINFASGTADTVEPKNITEALDGQHADQWKEAADSEYDSLIKNHTWDLVEPPEGKNIVGCKWVFKLKHNADGSIDRYKARLVAQGYSQEPGQDYDEIYAPVAKYTSIRSVLAIANQLDLDIHQMDIKTTFLNGNLENEIFMRQPEGYVSQEHPNFVCKLNKGIYGLKQAARCWNVAIDDYLKSSGYTQSTADPCIYSKIEVKDGKKCIMIIAVYVDDTLLASNDDQMLRAEKAKLGERFEMDDRGQVHYLLGMSIQRERESKILTISQKSYLENILKRFGMQDCKPVSTPLEPGKKYDKLQDDRDPVDVQRYQAAIGSLIYASIASRPDIAEAVGVLSQFMARPGPEHWTGVKRIFRYIKGTLDFGLKYVASDKGDLSLQGYSDADWAGDVSTRKSTSGYVFKLGGATISWKSKRQSVVALSSTEAEYVALSSAAQETVWLRHLLSSIGFEQSHPTILYEDNQGAIALSKNPKDHPRTKHIDIKYHYIRECMEKKEAQLIYCTTEDMLADILTKGLPKVRYQHLRSLLGVAQIG